MNLKSIFTATAICGLAHLATAQPVLTASNAYAVGSTPNLYTNTTYTNPGGAGPNQTWNFSNQTFTGPSTSQFTTCAGVTPPCSNFGSANMVMQDAAGNKAYYQVTNSAQTFFGAVSSSGTVSYTNGEDQLRFPMNYNTSFTDQFAGTVNNNVNTPFPRYGTDSVHYDGYGTLTTPAGTYNNAMRIKHVQRYKDSMVVPPMTVIVDYVSTNYIWYIPNARYPVYNTGSWTMTMMSNSTTTNYSGYSVPTLGIMDKMAGQLNADIFPNPANDFINIRVDEVGHSKVSFLLTDMAGKRVKAWPALSSSNHSFSLPVSELNSGIYLLQIESKEGRATKKVTIQ